MISLSYNYHILEELVIPEWWRRRKRKELLTMQLADCSLPWGLFTFFVFHHNSKTGESLECGQCQISSTFNWFGPNYAALPTSLAAPRFFLEISTVLTSFDLPYEANIGRTAVALPSKDSVPRMISNYFVCTHCGLCCLLICPNNAIGVSVSVPLGPKWNFIREKTNEESTSTMRPSWNGCWFD